jgi:hypothetical protein
MAAIPVESLVVGHEYKFQCPGRPMNAGRLLRVITTGAGPQVQFHKVVGEASPRTIVTVQGNRCTFTESREGAMKSEVSQAKKLPPNVENILKKFGGKSRKQRRRRAMKKTRSRPFSLK